MGPLEDAMRLAEEFERIRSQTAKAAPGITQIQTRVLMLLLRSAPMSHAALVAALGRDKAQVSKAVRALAEKGLVESAQGLHHKRQRDLYLTTGGRQLAESVQSGGPESALARFVQRIGQQGRMNLGALVRCLPPDGARAGAEARLTLRAADQADLLWLLEQADGRPQALGPFDNLKEWLKDLFEHVHIAEDLEHRWVLENWGARIGGVVLTPDRQALENAWIKLLRVNSGGKAAYGQLIRKCVSAAEAQTYELLRIEIPQADEILREVLREIGFSPVKSEVKRVPGGQLKLITYQLRLLPPLDPDQAW